MAIGNRHTVIHDIHNPKITGQTAGTETGPILYLIAFRDNTIRAAMTYRVANGTLHYLDTSHKERQAPVSSVDRDISAQLNRERPYPLTSNSWWRTLQRAGGLKGVFRSRINDENQE